MTGAGGTTNPVPFVDLSVQHRQIADEIDRGLQAVLSSGAFIGGPDVVAFEEEYAAFVGAQHCVGVANGTDAIELALRALGISGGGEVILPANTFIATAEAVARAGCTPVFVDCDPYYLIDSDAAKSMIGPRTAAIIGVDLYGQVAPFELFDGVDVPVLEDAAQSQGASRHGRGAGTFGLAAATSFYPGKNLGAYGDAGAVTTDHAEVALTIRTLGSHGGLKKYEHRLVGMNSRLDTVQAVVLRAKLRRLVAWNEQRREAARRYAALLEGVGEIGLPATVPGNEHAWHLFVVEVPERQRVAEYLQRRGISVGIHYPTPVHLTEAFQYLGYRSGAFPVAEATAQRILSLPMFPGITEDQQQRVAQELVAAVAGA